MTADALPRHPAGELRPRDWDRVDEPGPLGRLFERLRPDEGWLSVVLVLVMAGTTAWSIADARWILGRDDLTSFVIWIGIAAALWGYVGSRLNVAPWIAQVAGAVIGAFVLIEVVGSVVPLAPQATPGLVGWFQATAYSVTQAYLDLTWRHQIATTQYGHFCLIIGIVVWGTAQAASYDVFGYHRAINGVLLMAVILIANMALTGQDQFPALVLFSAAALVLLLGAHAADERTSLQRHRVWRGGDINTPRLQNGLGFASAAICGALILTTVASSAPLANAWSGLGGNFHDVAIWVSTYLPTGGQSRFSQGGDFGSSTVIGSSFSASNSIVLTIQMPEGAPNSHWRVISYDSFRSNGWAAGAGSQSGLQPGDGLNDGTLDRVDAAASTRTTFTYTVNVRDASLEHLVVANEPVSATVPVTRVLVGGSPPDSDVVWFPTDSTNYSVTSAVPNLDLTGAGLTEWQLRRTGTSYPAAIRQRYTQGADLVGDAGKGLLSQIESWASANGVALDPKTGHFANAYDAAKAIQDYLRDPNNFTYDANISDLACGSMTTVDCFATFKRGFCEQYATTMTMLMRMEGFPARYVEGYLSGPVEQASRAIDVTGQQRHAWVEVYFAGFGWVPFDPTGGSVGQPTVLAPGGPSSAARTPLPSASSSVASAVPQVTPRHGGAGSTSPESSDGGPGLMLLTAVIVLVVLLALLVVWRRRRRRLETPEAVYRSIVRVASRLGYRPLPTQTVYEYTGMLADVVPRARDPLGEVATAHVEVVYGRRNLPTERLVSLAAARRRVSQALLRLVFRIPGRGPKRPGKGRGKRS
jgi:Transglutaminase-like enzymes, putative cysteine proteases